MPLTQPGVPGATDVLDVEGGEGKPRFLELYLQSKRQGSDSTAVMLPFVAVLAFEDESGFREDVWNLEPEMTRLVSAEMGVFPDWQVVPNEVVREVVGETKKLELERAVEYGRLMEVDIVLLGSIFDYNMGRFSVGDPLLGGYKSYSGIAKMELTAVRVEDGNRLGTVEAERELIDRDLGLDLLGKPREQDVQFTGLKEVPFGSEEFRQTVLGKATLETIDELLQKLTGLVHPRQLKLGGQSPEILSAYGADVYINLGSENGVRGGYRFQVLPGLQRVREEKADPLTRVGVIEVKEIIGARLSSVRILEGEETIRAGDRLELLKIEE